MAGNERKGSVKLPVLLLDNGAVVFFTTYFTKSFRMKSIRPQRDIERKREGCGKGFLDLFISVHSYVVKKRP